MEFAIIGFGGMGQIRYNIATDLGHECIGIYDPLKGYTTKPITNARKTYVFICTKPSLHRQFEMDYEVYAKSLFIEKPYYGPFIGGWSHRYHSFVPDLKRKGPYKSLNLVWNRSAGIPGGWFVEESSVLEDLGSHLIDLASYLCDDIFKGVYQKSDFSKGDRKFKAHWWGGDTWNYKTFDTVQISGWCGDTPITIESAWAGKADEFYISGEFLNGDEFRIDIDPFEEIFKPEVRDFFDMKIQKKYPPVLRELK